MKKTQYIKFLFVETVDNVFSSNISDTPATVEDAELHCLNNTSQFVIN